MNKKMTVRETRNTLVALIALEEKHYPVRLSYAISKNINALTREVKQAEKERIKICESYASKDAEGKVQIQDNSYLFPDDKSKEACVADTDELLETEVEVDIFSVGNDVLEACEASERYDIPTIAEMSTLMFMIE